MALPQAKSKLLASAGGQAPGTGTNGCPGSDVRLDIVELTYGDHHVINNDTLLNFAPPQWKKGRIADATATKQLPEQFPVAYVRNTKVKLTAKFSVVEKPTCDTSVWIRGSAKISSRFTLEWATQVIVTPSDTEVVITDVLSDVTLPNHITFFSPFTIEWFSNTGTSYVTRRTAGVSKNPLYVLLDTPVDPKTWGTTVMYWTTVDLSCRYAKGKTQEGTAVTAFYKAFQGAQRRKPRPIKRMRDDKIMTYWSPVLSTQYQPPTTHVFQMLHNVDACGRCGAWSTFMIDMCKLHGINSARQIAVTYSPDPNNLGMLVKKWKFSAKADLNPAEVHNIRMSSTNKNINFTHNVYSGVIAGDPDLSMLNSNTTGGCIDKMGVAAQGNPDPWPLFWDHAIVQYAGKYYDPSYGTPTQASELEWESAALDGIFWGNAFTALRAAKHPKQKVFDFADTGYA